MTSAETEAPGKGRGVLLPLRANRGRYCDFSDTIGPGSDPRVQAALRQAIERCSTRVTGMAEIAGLLYRTTLYIAKDDPDIAYVETDENCRPVDAPKAPPILPGFDAYIERFRDRCSETDALTPDTSIALEAAFIPPSFELAGPDPREQIGFEELRNYARLVIAGPPGAGKTSSLRRIGLDVTSRSAGPLQTLPILVELRHFPPGDLTPAGISALVGTNPATGLRSELKEPLSGGRVLLLIDGLDELTGQGQHDLLLAQLTALCKQVPCIRVVLTTRDPVPDLDGFVQSRIMPFNTAQVQQWTRHYLRLHSPERSRWSEFIDLVHYDQRFRELVSNPLMLGLASSLHWNYPDELNSRLGLLRNCIDVLIQDWDAARGIARWRHSDVTPRQIRVLLYKLSARLAAEPRKEFSLQDVEAEVSSMTGFRESADVLLWACQASGLVRNTSDDRYSIAHRSFADYFAANDAIRKTENVTHTIQESSAKEDGSNFWRLACALTTDADELLTEAIKHGAEKDERAAAFMLVQALGEEVSARVSTIEDCCRQVIQALEIRLGTAAPLAESDARAPWPPDPNRVVVWAGAAVGDRDGKTVNEFRTSARLLELIYRARTGTAGRYLREQLAVSNVELVRQAADALGHDGWCDYHVQQDGSRTTLYVAITQSAAPETERAVLRPPLLSLQHVEEATAAQIEQPAMAQRTQILFEDDIDGSQAEDTVRFGYDGNDFEIDLSRVHANEFARAIEPYVRAARKATRSRRRARGIRPALHYQSEVRVWARERGLKVSDRGRIPDHILASYEGETLLQNLGPVIASLKSTRDAVLRIGALLIVKADSVVQVYQLTAAQQAVLDHQPQLTSSPREIITALELSASKAAEVIPPTE